jgi:hypothetical protein
MRNRVIGSCLMVLSLLFVGSRPAAAQGSGVSVSGSYDFFYHELGDDSALGAHFDVAKSLGMVDVVGEIGFNHFDGATVSSYQVGPRFNVGYAKSSKFTPFVQFLLGGWHCCGDSEFVIQPGVGVDFGSNRGFDIRVQYDYRRIFFEDEGANAHRVSAGVVKRF